VLTVVEEVKASIYPKTTLENLGCWITWRGDRVCAAHDYGYGVWCVIIMV
jgi:hypothetical protein